MFKFLQRKAAADNGENGVQNQPKKRVNFPSEMVQVVSEEREESRHPKIRRMSSSVTPKVTKKGGSRFWFPTKVFAALKLSRKRRGSKRKNSTKINKRKNSHRTSAKKKRHKSESSTQIVEINPSKWSDNNFF